MKSATKGALAAVTAVALLSGGAGTLAYWTGTQDVTGGSITAGKLVLGTPMCDGSVSGTHGWQYDSGDAFTPGTSKIVPGDTISKVCDITLTLEGNDIGATLGLATPSFETGSDANLAAALNGASATFKVDDAAYTPITKPGVYHVQATVSVPFPSGTTAANTQNVSVALKDLTLTATQTHDTAAN